jgi:glycosyltransferase involved in cell wall biosynthesis
LNKPLPENLKCLGLLSHKDAIDAFKRAEIYVMPSNPEGFKITVLEAMALQENSCGNKIEVVPAEIITNRKDGFSLRSG